MKKEMIVLVGAALVLIAFPVKALSDEDEADASAGEVSSIDAIANTASTSGAYARSAEYCMTHGHIDKAISLCQKALDKQDDPDLHQIYAEALERKLKSQVDKDPKLFRKCVSEWLIVLRQVGGDENLTWHGLGIPGVGKFYEDESRTIPAKQHITQLTGRLPKVWETNEKFLNKVTKESEAKVSGKLVSGKPKQTKPEQSDDDDDDKK
jgi:tetratricopeptide (TPR) repeat protein